MIKALLAQARMRKDELGVDGLQQLEGKAYIIGSILYYVPGIKTDPDSIERLRVIIEGSSGMVAALYQKGNLELPYKLILDNFNESSFANLLTSYLQESRVLV